MVGHPVSGYVWCRAETRNSAKSFNPIGGQEWIDIHVLRQPWLDGPGPEREIDTVWIKHGCPDDLSHWDYGCPEPGCVDGEIIDREATLAGAAV